MGVWCLCGVGCAGDAAVRQEAVRLLRGAGEGADGAGGYAAAAPLPAEPDLSGPPTQVIQPVALS
jgi:hypothetical protein